jgi:hypothetical protein
MSRHYTGFKFHVAATFFAPDADPRIAVKFASGADGSPSLTFPTLAKSSATLTP